MINFALKLPSLDCKCHAHEDYVFFVVVNFRFVFLCLICAKKALSINKNPRMVWLYVHKI